MTHALQCLRSSPLEVSRGLIITECDTAKPNIYVNYTPFFLYGMWLTTEIFGNGEWAHRLFFLIFSSLNILMVFLIAKQAWPKKPTAWLLAGFFQAFFLSPMYLGTHMDPVTEMTVTPMLVSTWLALRGRMFPACLWALVAGLTTWVGYFQFVPLLIFSWARRQQLALVLGLCVASAVVCFGSLMFLRGTSDLMEFLTIKLSNPEYIRPATWTEKLLLPLQFVRNFFQSLARLLSPLFASFALYEFIFGRGRGIWTFSRKKLSKLEADQWAFVLTGFAFIAYMVPGFKYAMVHIHNYVFAIPMWALLCASFVHRLLDGEKLKKPALAVLLVAFVASYPYGIYQSSLTHDVINSIGFILGVLAFMFFVLRKKPNFKFVPALLVGTAFFNFSQVMNYRNEADTEFTFCEWAKGEYARTHAPIHTKEPFTRTKAYLYCRGIPIVYEGDRRGI